MTGPRPRGSGGAALIGLCLAGCVSSAPGAPRVKAAAAAEPVAAQTWPAVEKDPARPDPPVTDIGSDQTTLPARYPAGVWLPIEQPLLSLQVVVRVQVEGQDVLATLDSGASSSVMSTMTFNRVAPPDTEPVGFARVMDAHGDLVRARRFVLDKVQVGSLTFNRYEVLVVPGGYPLFLIGAEKLEKMDVFLAADEGVVGLFPPGRAPIEPGATRVRLHVEDQQPRLVAYAQGPRGREAAFTLIVDTGASETALPVGAGLKAGLVTDHRATKTTMAIGGEAERRGRFVVGTLQLGDERVPVHNVLAQSSRLAGGKDVGLLGNDVLMRHRTVLRLSKGELFLSPLPDRPTTRHRGPGGAVCTARGKPVPCIHVAVEHGQDPCLRVRIHPVYSGTTVEMALLAEKDSQGPALAGGALRVFSTVGDHGVDRCMPMQSHTELDDARMSLTWVRTEGIIWPCDPWATECVSVSGPLADSGVARAHSEG